VIRVVLPHHLRTMARVGSEVEVDVAPPVTTRTVLDAVEAEYPMLRGTIRDHRSKERRAYLRYFACGEDLSFAAMDEALPDEVAAGAKPFMVVGAISGG
jgi:molybdopterin synthase sulfur carrier subunit